MKRSGAGFIIFREFNGTKLMLGLVGPGFHQKRCHGIYDIPKGVIDPGETRWETAIREAKEEAGYVITHDMLRGGPYTDGLLTIWMAQVHDDPIILPNPDSGIIEHQGYKWLKPEDLVTDCYNYLVPCVEWACKEISNV